MRIGLYPFHLKIPIWRVSLPGCNARRKPQRYPVVSRGFATPQCARQTSLKSVSSGGTGIFGLFTAFCLSALLLSGCATQQAKPYDYTNFHAHPPKSILVLPPLNNTTDVRATYSFLSTVTHPLAEAGYYVFPVALVDETFKENGLPTPGEMHQVPPQKLYEIFGADAVLYITIDEYGARHALLGGVTVVAVKARLVDTQTGLLLWDGQASASDNEGQNNNNNNLLGLLITGLIRQVADTVSDPGHTVAAVASYRLFRGGSAPLLLGYRAVESDKK